MMQDPHKIIEKTTKYIRNPDVAKFQEMQESNEHLSNIVDKLDTHSEPLKKMNAFLEAVKGEKGDKGEKPTDKELEELIKPLIPEPIKGEKGNPFLYKHFTPEQLESLKIKGDKGEDGIDGQDADEQKIIQTILSKIPKPKDGENGKDGTSPKSEVIVRETIKHLQSLKGNDRPSLKIFREADDLIGTVSLHKNMMSRMPKSLLDGDQRWGGHGVVLNAGSNVTITQNSDGSYTINSTGGGGGSSALAFETLTVTDPVNGTSVFNSVNNFLYIVSGNQTFFNGNGYTQSGSAGAYTYTLDQPAFTNAYGGYLTNSSGTLTFETLLGANGTNLVFTSTHNLLYIVSGNQTFFSGQGYAQSGSPGAYSYTFDAGTAPFTNPTGAYNN